MNLANILVFIQIVGGKRIYTLYIHILYCKTQQTIGLFTVSWSPDHGCVSLVTAQWSVWSCKLSCTYLEFRLNCQMITEQKFWASDGAKVRSSTDDSSSPRFLSFFLTDFLSIWRHFTDEVESLTYWTPSPMPVWWPTLSNWLNTEFKESEKEDSYLMLTFLSSSPGRLDIQASDEEPVTAALLLPPAGPRQPDRPPPVPPQCPQPDHPAVHPGPCAQGGPRAQGASTALWRTGLPAG